MERLYREAVRYAGERYARVGTMWLYHGFRDGVPTLWVRSENEGAPEGKGIQASLYARFDSEGFTVIEEQYKLQEVK